MKRITFTIAIAILVTMAIATTAAPATAAAEVIRDTIISTGGESGVPDDCRPGVTGDISGTEVVDLQSVETSTGFHEHGTTTSAGRIDWSDGSYTIIESVDHFSFTAGWQTTVFTNAHEDSGNTYSASGVFLSRLTFHLVERFTVTGGVVRVEFERGHFHTSGEC